MHKTTKKILTVLTLGCFLAAGCTAPYTNKQNSNSTPGQEQSINTVYRVSPSSRTTSDWEMAYGVVSHDGKMILPIDNQEIYLIEDTATGEQIWIQTSTQYVDDPTLSAEDLWKDNNWEKVHNRYMLYDLEGNLIKDLGEDGISKVYDNLVVHYNGLLTDRYTDEVYFDDVHTIFADGAYYIMNTNFYNSVRVTDEELNVLYEGEGGIVPVGDKYFIEAKENGRRGIMTLDGKLIVPCQYDYFSSHYNVGMPYVVANDNGTETVYSVEDGSIIYQETGEHTDYNYVQYLLPECMIIQKREVVATAENGGWPIYQYNTQFYDYDGNPFGEKYQYLSPFSYVDDYRQALKEEQEAELLFNATTLDGKEMIINQDGEAIYSKPEKGWVTLVDRDRIIVQNSDDHAAMLCDMQNTRINEKDYTYMYTLYLENADGSTSGSGLIMASYELAGKTLYDLIDRDGNVIIERAKSIQGLAEDRYWVEKGFTQGMMDKEGNWIYEQSVFDSTVDE